MVGVVIPAYNEGENISRLVSALKSQTVSPSCILVLDNGSTDNTREQALSYGCRIERLRQEEFNHGKTRNLAVRSLETEYIIMTVADAYPASNTWIEDLLNGFSSRPSCMAVAGPQGAPDSTEYFPRDWLEVRKKGIPQTIAAIKPEWSAAADNCNTAYRRQALIDLPFPDVPFGEDLIWSHRAISRGWKINFVRKAGVYHYHQRSLSYYRERSRLFQKVLFEEFGIDLGSTIFNTVSGIKLFIREYNMSLPVCGFLIWIKWLPYAWRMALIRSSGFWDYFHQKNRFLPLGRDEIRKQIDE